LREGIRVCVCADNTLLSNTSAAQELAHVMQIPEIRPQDVTQIIEYGNQSAFPKR